MEVSRPPVGTSRKTFASFPRSRDLPDAEQRAEVVGDSESILSRLMATIESRKAAPSESSYTSKLLAGGVAKIGGKITEEAAEVVEAASEPGDAGRTHFIYECADLTYHLFVMMAHNGVSLAELETELGRRFGISGLAEKAARPPKA